MFSSLSSFYDNIRSYSLTGKKPGDKRQRDRYFMSFFSVKRDLTKCHASARHKRDLFCP